MFKLRISVLVIIGVILPACAFTAEPAPKPDPRLEQKVTYEAKSLPVVKTLDELSEKTGVKMVAGGSSKDWQVRDRRMNLFVKDVSLAELQKSISTLMHFRWSRSGEEGKWQYRLWQDKKSVMDEENKRIKAEEARARQEKKKRQDALEALSGLDNLTPEQLEKLKQENPYMYVAAKSGVGQGFKQFFGGAPGVMDALMNGQEAKMKVSDLPPASQQGLMSSLQSIVKMMGGREVGSVQKLMENFPNATLDVNSSKKFLAGTPMSGQILGDISIRAEGGGHFELPFIDPNSNMAKVMGQMIIKMMEGVDPQQAGQGMQGQFMMAMAADMAKDAAALVEKEEPQPDDPELEKKIELKVDGGGKLEQVLGDLSKASNLAVISDSFPGRSFGMVKIDEKEITIKDALDKITKGYNCRWRKEGSIIRVQDKNWYQKRAAQIPDEWIEAWAETLKSTGTLDIDDLGAIASLSDEQINMNLREQEEPLRSVTGMLMAARDPLRFYATLESGQVAAMASEQGLGAHLLTPGQWSYLHKVIQSKNPSLLPNPPIPLTVYMKSTPKDKRFIYNFTVTSTESDQTASWDVTTPPYVPKEEKSRSNTEGKK